MPKIVTFGEIMLRLACPEHLRFSQAHSFEATFGGGEANVAVSLANFGFDGARSATLPGLNAKLPEILAVMARARLAEIDTVCDARAGLEAAYREALSDFGLQAPLGRRRAMRPTAAAARRSVRRPRRDAPAPPPSTTGPGGGGPACRGATTWSRRG